MAAGGLASAQIVRLLTIVLRVTHAAWSESQQFRVEFYETENAVRFEVAPWGRLILGKRQVAATHESLRLSRHVCKFMSPDVTGSQI